MNELIAKIEQWAEDRNIIKGTKPIDQAMKLFSEFGELADNVGKGRDCRDDIGDVFVVLTIMCKQLDESILDHIVASNKIFESDKACVSYLANRLAHFVRTATNYEDVASTQLILSISCLIILADFNNTTLQECVQIAYNDIKDRKGIVYNGLFIKESDPAYQDALDNIEADKRLATQKRISVNIKDL